MDQESPKDCRIRVIEILSGFGDGRLGGVIICETVAVRMPLGFAASVMNENRGFVIFFLVVSMCGLLRGFFKWLCRYRPCLRRVEADLRRG